MARRAVERGAREDPATERPDSAAPGSGSLRRPCPPGYRDSPKYEPVAFRSPGCRKRGPRSGSERRVLPSTGRHGPAHVVKVLQHLLLAFGPKLSGFGKLL